MPECVMELFDRRSVRFDFDYKAARYFMPRFLNGRSLFEYEPISQCALLAAIERSEGALFDVGSNIGIFSVLWAKTFGRDVYAFEPFKEASSILKAIAERHDLPIHVQEAAVGATSGEQEFYISDRSDMSNSMNPAFREHIEVRRVRTIAIDDFAADIRPALIKIDTESTEVDVLQGAIRTLERHRPVLLLEVLDDDLKAKLDAVLATVRYRMVGLCSPAFTGPLGDLSGVDLSGDQRNFLAVPAEYELDTDYFARARHWLDRLRGLEKCSLK